MTEAGSVQWRRDADTSATIRSLWAVGVGTLLAAISLVVFGRLFFITGETAGQPLVVAGLVALAVTILAFAIAGRTEQRLASIARYVPGFDYEPGGGDGLRRALDAAVGAVVMAAVIVTFDLLVGGNVGELLAALTIPLALVVLVAAVFLRSTGALDREEGVLYLYDPEDAIDLDDLAAVAPRYVGDTAIVKLRYRQPDGVYVPGPRRLVVPAAVARELEATVGTR
ncbi:hypothetical protein [Halovivax sp.]|uniref:hypothetical protein n=1 Tax=Halovivax sp. TaxID=1935978 RepID=UPI0025C65404|nr:hypothetical protein [Halovivax sp.]